MDQFDVARLVNAMFTSDYYEREMYDGIYREAQRRAHTTEEEEEEWIGYEE